MKRPSLRLCGLTAAVLLGVLATVEWLDVRDLMEETRSLQQQRATLRGQLPEQPEVATQALEAKAQAAQAHIETWQAQYISPEPESADTSEAAWLQVAAFAEDTQAAFATAKVPLHAPAFGFARTLASGAVADTERPAIAARLELAATLSTALRYARPERVLAVEFETIEPAPPETLGVRAQITFEGSTTHLRAFLARLSQENPRLRTSLQQVQPLQPKGEPPAAYGPSQAVVVAASSRFTVEVEALYGEARSGSSLAASTWAAPVPQDGGPGWIYELFTPPEVFFDPAAARFVASPPGASEPDRPALKLESLGRQLYRFQYAGHGGEGDRLVVTLFDAEGEEWFSARAGTSFPERQLKVEAVEASVQQTAAESTTPVRHERIRVRLHDTREDLVRTIGAEPAYQAEPTAELFASEQGERFFLQNGQTHPLPGGTLTAEALDSSQGEALLRWAPETAAPQRFILRLDPRAKKAAYLPPTFE